MGKRKTNRKRILQPQRFLFVHVVQHERNVRRQQIIHFVAQRRLAQQFRTSNQVADCHVEVGVARRPVGYARERMSHQQFLRFNNIFDLVHDNTRLSVTFKLKRLTS